MRPSTLKRRLALAWFGATLTAATMLLTAAQYGGAL